MQRVVSTIGGSALRTAKATTALCLQGYLTQLQKRKKKNGSRRDDQNNDIKVLECKLENAVSTRMRFFLTFWHRALALSVFGRVEHAVHLGC